MGRILIGFIFLFFSIKAHCELYIVKKNETLMTISYKFYGTHQCWDIILAASPSLKGGDAIEVGAKVNIPHFSKCTHRNAAHNQSLNDPIKGFSKRPENIPNNFAEEIKQKATILHKNLPTINAEDKNKTRDDEFFKKLEEKVRTAEEAKESKLEKIVEVKKQPIKDNSSKIKKTDASYYTIQLVAFSKIAEAQRFFDSMTKYNMPNMRIERVDLPKKGPWYRVRVGKFKGFKAAKNFVIKGRLHEISRGHYIVKEKVLKSAVLAVKPDKIKEERVLENLKNESEKRFDRLLDELDE